MSMTKNVNLRRLFSRENHGALVNFIKGAEEDAGIRTTITPADIVAATESAMAVDMNAGGLPRRRRSGKKYITLNIPCRAGGAGVSAEVMIDSNGLWFALSAAVIGGNAAAT